MTQIQRCRNRESVTERRRQLDIRTERLRQGDRAKDRERQKLIDRYRETYGEKQR